MSKQRVIEVVADWVGLDGPQGAGLELNISETDNAQDLDLALSGCLVRLRIECSVRSG